jgi:hypothetical protein
MQYTKPMSWTNFFKIKEPYFPKVVRSFYFKAKTFQDKSLITSTINGVEIILTLEILAKILCITTEGITVYNNTWYREEISCRIELLRKMFSPTGDKIDHVSSKIKFEYKLFHSSSTLLR